MIDRLIKEKIRSRFFNGKVIVLLGARRVGKTTLSKIFADEIDKPVVYLNGDEYDVRELFNNATSTKLKATIGKGEFVIIDEAQRIENIGLALKLIVDNYPQIQVLATGSSSFELGNKLNEPLTGRKIEYILWPLSFSEMLNYTDILQEKRLLEHRLIYGYYPEVVINQGNEQEVLKEITNSYLYKDIITLGKIKKYTKLEKLVQALAFQIGNEVSYNELAGLTGLTQETVENYIDILEKSFIVFRLRALKRNLRNELKKAKKVYFYDLGVRNAVIRNFNPLSLRNDTGALWENFIICERLKSNQINDKWVNTYFWRTTYQQEIDYIEEYGGKMYAYEFKWTKKSKVRFPKKFKEAYPQSECSVITPDNFESFIS